MEQNLISYYSSVRSYRPKGLDKARILQAVLLVAICIWLLYLINNSHHKQENEVKSISIANLTTLGRKGFAEYTTRAKAKTRGKNALGELERGENAGREYEIDVNIDEGTDQSVLKLEEDEEEEDEEEESKVLNGKREATEAEFLLKKLYNISVDDNGEDALRVEAFLDENGIPPDAEESTDPRGAEPKNLDSRINESRNPIGHRR